MRLLAVVVLYHPDAELTANVNSYLPWVERVLLWDNTPADARRPLSLASFSHPERIEMRGCGDNVGIDPALNDAARYALEHGYTHLLTMDQDSRFPDGEFQRYVNTVLSYRDEHTDRKVADGVGAIFSVNYYLRSQHTTLYPQEASVVRVSSAMTSGSIYPVSLFRELGLFMEGLFVWGIDCEYCWRAARRGIPTYCFRDILLQHDLGYQRQKHRLLGREVFPNEYPPARTYYNVRNGIILHRLYPDFLNLKAHLRYHMWKRIVFVLLYEQQKCAKWRALWDGWRDGRRGRLGKRK